MRKKQAQISLKRQNDFHLIKTTTYCTSFLWMMFFVLFASQPLQAQSGEALAFVSNDYVTIANAPENNFAANNKFTIEFWCKSNSNSGASVFVNKGGGGGLEQYSFDNFGGSFRYYIKGSNFSVISIPRILASEGWVHIAGTYDGSINQMRLYKNGVLVATKNNAFSTLQNTTNPLALGVQAPPTLGQFLNGKLDEVRLWNYPRCQAEIQAQMNCEITGDEAGLTAYYQFNEGIANGNNAGAINLPDISGNGNDGTLNNFSLTGTTSNWIAPGEVTSGTSCAPIPSPTITCPADVSVSTDAGSCEATDLVLGTPVTSDNCTGEAATNDAPASYLVGTTTVTWTVTDAVGLTATCQQTVTVTDDEAPNPVYQNIIVELEVNGTISIDPTDIDAGSTDNCTAASALIFSLNQAVFDCSNLGTNTVTLTVDDGGNIASCTATVPAIRVS